MVTTSVREEGEGALYSIICYNKNMNVKLVGIYTVCADHQRPIDCREKDDPMMTSPLDHPITIT